MDIASGLAYLGVGRRAGRIGSLLIVAGILAIFVFVAEALIADHLQLASEVIVSAPFRW